MTEENKNVEKVEVTDEISVSDLSEGVETNMLANYSVLENGDVSVNLSEKSISYLQSIGSKISLVRKSIEQAQGNLALMHEAICSANDELDIDVHRVIYYNKEKNVFDFKNPENPEEQVVVELAPKTSERLISILEALDSLDTKLNEAQASLMTFLEVLLSNVEGTGDFDVSTFGIRFSEDSRQITFEKINVDFEDDLELAQDEGISKTEVDSES